MAEVQEKIAYEEREIQNYTWPSWSGRWLNFCHVEVHRRGNLALVIAKSREMNDDGASITNDAERLAGFVRKDYGIQQEKLLWVEYYPKRGEFPKSYELVQFSLENDRGFSKPRWAPVSRKTVDTLIADMSEGATRRRALRRAPGPAWIFDEEGA